MSPATSENAPDMIPAPAPAPPSPSAKKPSALARATANPRPPAVRLELALAAHAPGTLAIYNREVESGTATFDMAPRSLEEQLEWVAEHSGAHPAVVALSTDGAGEDEVVGFGSLSLYRPRAAYSTTVEDSVYVAEGSQRLGIGRALLEELLRLAEGYGFHAVIARIAGGNEASVALHASCGFEMIGTEREVGRKFGRWLDVVCMERLI
jgi:L-amino acid N-acyltransferase YncA